MSEEYDMFQLKRCAIFAKRTDLLSGLVILNLKLWKDQAKRNVKKKNVELCCIPVKQEMMKRKVKTKLNYFAEYFVIVFDRLIYFTWNNSREKKAF